MDARGMKGAWEGAGLLRQSRAHREDPRAGDARAVVRGPPADRSRGTASPRCRACRPWRSKSSSKLATRARSRRSASTCPTTSASAKCHGSKSVSLSNVLEAYEKSMPDSYRHEFAWDDAEVERAKRWGAFASELTTEIHEVLGHGSGRMADHIQATPQDLLKEQYSALEESRADLVALYFVADPYLADARAGAGRRATGGGADRVRGLRAQCPGAVAPGARRRAARRRPHAQPPGHRPLAAGQHQGDRRAAPRRQDLLRDERRRMRSARASPGCWPRCSGSSPRATTQAARELFETYGVHFDPDLRDEVVARVDHLKLPSYTGFVMPRLEPVDRRLGRDHRREDLVSLRSDDADARYSRS